MAGRYHLVYDIADERVPHPAYLVVATMLLLTGIVTIVYRSRRQHHQGPGPWLIAAALGFAGSTSVKPWWEVWHLKQQMRTQAFTVEGVITAHAVDVEHTAPAHMRTRERFQVDSLAFRFVREADIAGFHNAGDPLVDLHDGLPVRIRYLLDVDTVDVPRIVRLEVFHPDASAGP